MQSLSCRLPQKGVKEPQLGQSLTWVEKVEEADQLRIAFPQWTLAVVEWVRGHVLNDQSEQTSRYPTGDDAYPKAYALPGLGRV